MEDRRPSTPRRPSRRVLAAFIAVNILAVVVLLGLAEGALVFLLRHPPASGALRSAASAYYLDVERSIIQYLPECARYDAALGYLLRPGSCRFVNREFDVRVDVNRAGLRDSEDALSAPRVIVLGDSHAMGWGVEADAAFPRQLGAFCATKVLNAGISSFGTAREVALLGQLDTTALEWLVVQYSDNDARENTEFIERGYRVVPMPEAAYQEIQAQVLQRPHYYPGRHFVRFVPLLGSRLSNRLRPAAAASPTAADDGRVPQPGNDARTFLEVLTRADIPATTRVIVFEMNGEGHNTGRFAAALHDALAAGTYAEPWRSLTVIDPAAGLSDADYFVLDDHMTARGHRTVAAAIAAAMGCPTATASH
ncbi:MAG: hypothetical protein IT178_01790 [Acidobacteria bacterium]|nr:hypothetical protein [Acidobacteriota bacterium]